MTSKDYIARLVSEMRKEATETDGLAVMLDSAEHQKHARQLMRWADRLETISSRKVEPSLRKIVATVDDMRREARDASEDGEDMSVMREWASSIAASVRRIQSAIEEAQP